MALKRAALLAFLLAGCGDCQPVQSEAPVPPTEVAPAQAEQDFSGFDLERLGQSCANEPGAACAELGERLRNRAGEPEQARASFETGCIAEHGPSCVALGRMWRTGQGGAQSDSDALRWYQTGCEAGDPIGCNNAGILLRDGQGVAQDPVAALLLFQSACAAEYWVACEAFGRLVMPEGEAHPSFGAAKESLQRACMQGEELLACITLAEWSQTLDEDPEAARRFYSRACNLNDVPACVDFGRMAHSGIGGPVDQETGRLLLDMGCRRGVLTACVDLAEIYQSGAGVDVDLATAEAFLRHACEAGLTSACPPPTQ